MQIPSTIALSRLMAQQRALDVVAGNIANSSTPGFKAERILFTDWIVRQPNTAGPPGAASISYTQDRSTWRDMSQGTLSHTGNPFDLALSDEGYFTVATPSGTRLTRSGRFGLMPDGTVADNDGNALLDISGRAVQLGADDTRISIAGDGTISSENGPIGRVAVVRPPDPQTLKAEGSGRFSTDAPTTPVAAPRIVQGRSRSPTSSR
jgi:flagellar basal-body rod protein FlgF